MDVYALPDQYVATDTDATAGPQHCVAANKGMLANFDITVVVVFGCPPQCSQRLRSMLVWLPMRTPRSRDNAGNHNHEGDVITCS